LEKDAVQIEGIIVSKKKKGKLSGNPVVGNEDECTVLELKG
jgi:hypothetical protein